MPKQPAFPSMTDAMKKKRTRREQFLAEMDAVVPWRRLLALIEAHYPKSGPKGGRPPMPLETMLRIYFLQNWYSFGDPTAEEMLYDSDAMRRFAGIELGDDRIAVLVDQHAPKPVAGRAALAIAQFNETTLPGKDLHRQLAAVFAGHHAFDGLQQVGADAAVVLELLAAIVDPDPRTGADMFVICAFVRILKPAPAADVIDKNRLEVGVAGLDLGHQVLQRLAAVEPQSRPA